MHIGNSFTFGHLAQTQGSTQIYHGSTVTEGLAIGQEVSDSVQTSVNTIKIGPGADRMIISDLDGNPNLSVGFLKLGDGNYLSVTNRSGEFETNTSIPVALKDSELERAQNLEEGFDVHQVTVRQMQGAGTFISLADNAGLGERGYVVNPDGTLQAFLRGA